MKILHLIAGDLNEGAARGAYWLHLALRNLGIDSKILNNKSDDLGDPSISLLATTTWQKFKFALLPRLGKLPAELYRNRQPRLFNTGFEGVDITRQPIYRAADLIHLHWINGLVRIGPLRKVDKPIVWTLRDMWPLSGGCHYAMDCQRYRTGCGQCPQLGSRLEHDLTSLVVANKRKSLPKQLRPVGISHWLSDCANQSRVFAGFPVETISNNVDTTRFFPVDPALARQMLGLRNDKRIILVGSQRISDLHKGYELFLAALRLLGLADVHLVLFGRNNTQDLERLGVPYTSLGFLADTVTLHLVYSAADVFVAPSRMDAFGKTLAEAMACGTPVVCFDATGPKDIVAHQITGYKATPFEASDLAHGIRWVLNRPSGEAEQLRRQARERAVAEFDSRIIAAKYRDLYERLLGEQG